MNKLITCCFTGHKTDRLPFGFNECEDSCIKLKAALKAETEKQIIENGVSHFISGMAIGVDTFGAEIVLELKEKYPNITLECAIPCETQAVKWPEFFRERYFGIIAKCDKETMLQRHETPDCIRKKNKYMIDQSDYVIAVWDGGESGTERTIKYAQNTGKPVVIIDPNNV